MGRGPEKAFCQRRHSRSPTKICKDLHYYSSSGKYKLKKQWDIPSHLSEWSSKRQQVINDEFITCGNTHVPLVGI